MSISGKTCFKKADSRVSPPEDSEVSGPQLGHRSLSYQSPVHPQSLMQLRSSWSPLLSRAVSVLPLPPELQLCVLFCFVFLYFLRFLGSLRRNDRNKVICFRICLFIFPHIKRLPVMRE